MNRALRAVLPGLFSVLVLGAQAAPPPNIYGKDDRKDIYAVEDPEVRELARSVAALFESNEVSISRGLARLETAVYGKTKNLIATERFYEQPSGGICSAALIAPDMILTAAHCVEALPCKQMKIVFDFAYTSQDQDRTKPPAIPADSVYACAEVAKMGSWSYEAETDLMFRLAVGDDEGLSQEKLKLSGPVDYAFLRLDRSVSNRSPLVVNTAGGLTAGTKLFTIGHPSGLPAKWAGNARVRSTHKNIVLSDLDIYHGNSGGPVFNEQTKKIEGLVNFVLDGREFEFDVPSNLIGQERAAFFRKKGSSIKYKSKSYPQDGGHGVGVGRVATFAKELESVLSRGQPSFDGAGKKGSP